MAKVDKKNKERFDLTNKQERDYEGIVLLEYTDVYRDAKAMIEKFIAKYGVDGKLTNEAFKYDRYDKLIKNILASTAKIQATKPRSVDSYLKDQYEANFLYTGYNLETTYQQKLAFSPIKRSSIDPLSITGKISLQNNADLVRTNINQAITRAIAQGEGVGKTSQRVKKALDNNMNNALRISRTETTTALNEANMRGMEKAAEKLNIMKEWVATLDNRTRDRHRALDGVKVPLDKPYPNTGGMMYPGDPVGGASMVINCRCFQIEVLEGYENARDYRRARGVDGKNEIIPYKSYKEWSENRL